ncbi:MAG: hypothetical protein GTO18_03280 [Anaerolineales bacterium]|nr:hypothetical protein [Anaerolineales bacterium]
MIRWINRILLGAGFALPATLLTIVIVQATPATEPTAPPELDCKGCHSEFHDAWSQGKHAKAISDPVFQEAFEAQGRPVSCMQCHTTGFDPESGTWISDGVTCSMCHIPTSGDHPLAPMGTDRSGKLCGECHSETYFEWQVSTHRETELVCVDCHDSHGTRLKARNASLLCANCHRTRVSSFAHTQHSEAGLSCADCHLEELNQESGEGRSERLHSFNVELSTCNECHAYQMHDPIDVHIEQPEPETDAMASVENLSVSTEPSPVSPIGFAMLSGIIGMATGMILAPWLERWYRRLGRGEDVGAEDEQ